MSQKSPLLDLDRMVWSTALSLEERAASMQAQDLEAVSGDSESGSRRLGRWRSQAPFEQDAFWFRRWSSLGLDDRQLSHLLASPPDISRPLPNWWVRWRDLLAEGSSQNDKSSSPHLKIHGFLTLVAPLLADLATRFDALATLLQNPKETSPNPKNMITWDAVRSDFLRFTARSLQRILIPALVVELRIAGLEQGLKGENPEQRFEDFTNGLRDPAKAFDILCHYPVLARRLIEDSDRRLASMGEMLRHVTEDHRDLSASLGEQLGPLLGIAESGGDPHREGRRVLFARFAKGRTLVYKPRPMAVEVAVQGFLSWASERLESVPKTLWIFDRGDHGWMEKLEPTPCHSEHEISGFYRRQGTLLALLHLLGTTDLHHENVMAIGSELAVLDLETCCHPFIAGFDLSDGSRSRLAGSFEDTVLRVGLLPHRLRSRQQEKDGFDASGLGAEAGQTTPGSARHLSGLGTDSVELEHADGKLRSVPGLPILNGETVDPALFGRQVLAGFKAARQMLFHRREELASQQGPLKSFFGLTTRVVLRPTRIYGRLLQDSNHPHLLGDATDSDLYFDRLWLGAQVKPWLVPAIESEHRDLRRADVPYFTTRTDSLRIWDAQGEDLGELLWESGWQGIQRRLSELGPESDLRQATLVFQAFELRAAEKGHRPRLKSNISDQPAPSSSELMEGVWQAADRLAESAFVDDRAARWWVPQRLSGNRWTLAEAGPDLYFGHAGIALFLSWAAEIGGRSRDRELAEATLETIEHQLSFDDESLVDLGLKGIGAFSGWGGVIHSLVQLGRMLNRSSLIDLAVAQVERLADSITNDRHFDVLGGSAGAAIALCRLAAIRPEPPVLQAALRCGEHLVLHAQKQKVGMGWNPPHGSGQPLAGLSHGASGIAWALLELAGTLEDSPSAFMEVAVEALRYEESLFHTAEGNWRDLRQRPEDEQERFLVAWCHGAPGIGLARLAILRTLRSSSRSSPNSSRSNTVLNDLEPLLKRDVERAVRSTSAQGFGLTHSLCHGDLGNIDFLIEAAAETRDSDLAELVNRRAGGISASIKKQGFLYGTPAGTNPPGLMVGTAGIGFGLLRLATSLMSSQLASQTVPSILCLAPSGDDTSSKSCASVPGDRHSLNLPTDRISRSSDPLPR